MAVTVLLGCLECTSRMLNFTIYLCLCSFCTHSLINFNHICNILQGYIIGLFESHVVWQGLITSLILNKPLIGSFLRSLCAILDRYISKRISLDPPIHFGSLHSYNTRCPPHFATTLLSRLFFHQQFFRQRQFPGGSLFQMKFILFPQQFI